MNTININHKTNIFERLSDSTKNVIHLNSDPLSTISNMFSELNDNVKKLNNNLSENYATYEELLQSAKDQIKKIEANSSNNMTMEEYKTHINDKLQSLIRDATRYQDEVAVIITDAGFEAMKSDSTYEDWVIYTVKQNLQARNYLYGWTKNSAMNCTHQFGATKEEYRGYSGSLHSFGSKKQIKPPTDDTEDYWTMRRKRTEKILEMQQEMFENIYQLKELSKRKTAMKAAQAKAVGEVDTSNPMPVIVGVPAEYLLSGLI